MITEDQFNKIIQYSNESLLDLQEQPNINKILSFLIERHITGQIIKEVDVDTYLANKKTINLNKEKIDLQTRIAEIDVILGG